jgi:hypothetical protein
MAIQDTDPERRNLNVTSIAFIAYYYAGGEVLDNEVRIQVVNVVFSHPYVLASMAWFLLVWFALRFWQTRNARFLDEFVGELQAWKDRSYLLQYAEKKLSLKANVDGGFAVNSIVKHPNEGWGINYSNVKDPTYNNVNGRIEVYTVTGDGFLRLPPFISLPVFVSCALAKTSFTGYVVPYILFCLACFGPVFRGIF